VTDVRRDRDPVAAVRAALAAGVPVVQVRVADHVSDLGAYHFTALILDLCREAGAKCLVNDRLHIALATGADGGHVGGDDLPVTAARRVLGPDAVLGTTAHDAFTAQAAVAAGASYLSVSPSVLPEVAAAVSVPVIATGSVTPERIPGLIAAGAYGIAVSSAISDAADPGAVAASLMVALSHTGTVGPGDAGGMLDDGARRG
jgi:thiamine-phosphate pyrophosphorylase